MRSFVALVTVFFAVIVAMSADTPVFSEPLWIPPILEYRTNAEGTKVFSLQADESQVSFFPSSQTRTLGYNGAYLGPTIRVSRGDRVSINLENRLDDPTSIHWHGADVPAESDGGPHQGIPPGTSWSADFIVRQQAATLWYHPHFFETTAQQVYEGLAGLLIIEDEVSRSLDLPDHYGVDDIPIILQERRFDGDGEFSYRPRMPDLIHGYFGNRILVNGGIQPFVEVPRGLIRLRLLNGSNSTFLRLTLEDLDTLHHIASDGGFLEDPVPQEDVVLSPGERAEILVDFSEISADTVHLFAETNAGSRYEAMEFRLVGPSLGAQRLPTDLVVIDRILEGEAHGRRMFELSSGMGGRMLINGRSMDMGRIDQQVPLGNTEIWTVVNRDGGGGGMMGGMMNQPHNFHVHAVQFQILDINGRPPPPEWSGWKDTVLLWPGDQVRLIARFHSYPGIYMYHCHLLEHEDAGMMGQFEIVEE